MLAFASAGETVSKTSFPLTAWTPAVVPGTVLTSMLYNNLAPDPFYGMNNTQIPDIYDAGKAFYTYWFAKDFTVAFPAGDDKVWLSFRGINYSWDVYVNGHKLNKLRDSGMFLRHTYDITPLLSKDGNNRLAVIVYPPDPPGNPNGGQGGDGMIAHSVTNQFAAGWDWIQAVHDRNTGIWDKVFIKKTKQVTVTNTHVVTHVPGVRLPDGRQEAATLDVSTDVENFSEKADSISVIVAAGRAKAMQILWLAPHEKRRIFIQGLKIYDPRLWWPNGYGPQNMYELNVRAYLKDIISDSEHVNFGIREINALWNEHTRSREIHVNGQRIFIKGGNWIMSDAMLRFSKERYDAEIRYHRDMNLNLVRVWGGGITERPEFYDACDKYGLLVMQDFWVSGDCNGRWDDPMKKEDTTARRNYPDDHSLFLESMIDNVKMLRNHPSLALWCGGNEIRPPKDILVPFRDSLLPALDGARFFFEYSNDDSMSLHSGDGPYTIQADTFFWTHRSFPFNSEVGSVGIGDHLSLQRFIPESLLSFKINSGAVKTSADSMFQYHKFISYSPGIEAYGPPCDAWNYSERAQLLNYNQYRALTEAHSAYMWDWYTGFIIWKTQNPWTAMGGQMYDVYLDPNAGMFGLREGARPLHIMRNPVTKEVLLVNNTAYRYENLSIECKILHDRTVRRIRRLSSIPVPPHSCISTGMIADDFPEPGNTRHFLALCLSNPSDSVLDKNVYWLPDSSGSYAWLSRVHSKGSLACSIDSKEAGKVSVSITDTSSAKTGYLAFFIRVDIRDKKTGKRILPFFCNNNYFSVLPGETETVELEYQAGKDEDPEVCIRVWNSDLIHFNIEH